jgi:hypothetical protein
MFFLFCGDRKWLSLLNYCNARNSLFNITNDRLRDEIETYKRIKTYKMNIKAPEFIPAGLRGTCLPPTISFSPVPPAGPVGDGVDDDAFAESLLSRMSKQQRPSTPPRVVGDTKRGGSAGLEELFAKLASFKVGAD